MTPISTLATPTAGPDPTSVQPRVDTAERARRRRRARIGVGLIAGAFLLALAGLITLTALGMFRTGERDVATGQRDDAAQQARAAGAPAAALCRSNSEAAPVLRAAGVCQAAESALANPVVAQNSAPLTPEEVNAIVARVLPLTSPAAPLVPDLLDRLSADPAAQGLDEAATRSVVAGAAGQAEQAEQADPAPDPDREEFTGLRFERAADGSCRGITTFTRPDGTTREQGSAAPDGACGSVTPPAPRPTTDPPNPTPNPTPTPSDEPTSSSPPVPSGAPGQTGEATPTS